MIRDVHECNPVTRRDWVDSRRGPGLSLDACPVEQPRTHACRQREVERLVETECALELVAFAKHLNRLNREWPLTSEAAPRSDSARPFRPERSPECGAVDDKAPKGSPRHGGLDFPRLGDVTVIEAVRVERRLLTVYRIVLASRPGRMIDIFA
jgi:hypothetical protein